MGKKLLCYCRTGGAKVVQLLIYSMVGMSDNYSFEGQAREWKYLCNERLMFS